MRTLLFLELTSSANTISVIFILTEMVLELINDFARVARLLVDHWAHGVS